MSRHGRKVPTSFYHRFTVDARAFADRHAKGRLLSVLEGGYSDRALASGAMAHLCGLANPAEGKVDEQWWNVENLEKVAFIDITYFPTSAHCLAPFRHSWRKPPRNAAGENSL